MPLAAAALLSAAAATAGVSLLSPCAPGTGVCYVAANFTQNCLSIGGATVEVQTVPYCALPAPATQFQQCGGVSCYTTGQSAFAGNCTSTLGGFVSGSATTANGIPFCIVPRFVSVFTACPDSAVTGCVVSQTDAQFAQACVGLGGFIDAFLQNAGGTLIAPQCVAPATVVSACGGVLSGCAPDANFTAACTGRGGFVPAIADGAPTCALPGPWTVWAPSLQLLDLGTFASACGALGGFVGSPGVCLLPCPSGACGAPASVSSASATGTPSPSRPPSASAPVTTTPLPSRSGAAGAGLASGAVALAAALAAVLVASSSFERW